MVDNSRILLAIDCIVRDVDKKYDECLVEHFLKYIHTTYVVNDWIKKSAEPLDRIKSYLDHKSFVMMNQARAYKIFHSIVKDNLHTLDEESISQEFLPYLDSFSSTIDIVVINDNLSAVTVLLSILKEMTSSKFGFDWLCNFSFEPTIKLNRCNKLYEIKDLISLTTYYSETCNNYHTKNKSEDLLGSFILKSTKLQITEDIKLKLNTTIKELIGMKSSSILNHIILSTLNHDEVKSLEFHYKIATLLHTSLLDSLTGGCDNIRDLCRFLAKVNSKCNIHDSSHMANFLLKMKHTEATMLYLTNLDCSVIDEYAFDILFGLILYTIFSRSTPDQNLKDKLEEFKYYKDHHKVIQEIPDKTLAIAMSCLSTIVLKFDAYKLDIISQIKYIELTKDVLIQFIKTNYLSINQYKDVIECCNILSILTNRYHMLTNDKEFEFDEKFLTFFRSILNTILTLKYDTQRTKIILIKLLKSIEKPHKYSEIFNSLIELAFKFTEDEDVIKQFLHTLEGSGVEGTELSKMFENYNRKFLDKFRLEFEKIMSIIEEYLLEKDNNIEDLNQDGDKVISCSIVEDIINYEQNFDGIIDCY